MASSIRLSPGRSSSKPIAAGRPSRRYVSENSRQEVVATPCQLSVANGARTFWASHQLTADQYNTLKSVVVTRIYE